MPKPRGPIRGGGRLVVARVLRASKRPATSAGPGQTLRSDSDNHVFVVCYDSRFAELPDHVRHQAPWQCITARSRSSRPTTSAHLMATLS